MVGHGAGHEITGAGHVTTGHGAGQEITGAGAGQETTVTGHEITGAGQEITGAGHTGWKTTGLGQQSSSSPASALDWNPASVIVRNNANPIKIGYFVFLNIIYLP